MSYERVTRGRNPNAHPFLFATGIEGSYPVIQGKDGRPKRKDLMAETGHYRRWREDFALVKELGLGYLRYGPPYYLAHRGPGKYDWSFADETFAELQRLEIIPIADLCHFGVPDWVGNFQNPDWPELFAEYAEAFARRFPWVRLYTPVNEIYVCATQSAHQGNWNERQKSDQAFVTAIKHLARANLLAQQRLLDAKPNAVFIQSEETTYYHAKEPAALERAAFRNNLRFLSLDLSYGHEVTGTMLGFLMDHGFARQEYQWFLQTGHHLKSYAIMGNDYYRTNERDVPAEGEITSCGEIFGYYIITEQYFRRYHLPVMHTETNIKDDKEAPHWLWKQWCQMLRLKEDGVPIVGFTWYSLTDQIDWDTALAEDNGNVNPLGLVDLDRRLRPVGKAYQELVRQWKDILPMETLGLTLHMQDWQPPGEPIELPDSQK